MTTKKGVIAKPSLYLVEWLDPRAHNDTEPAEADLARCKTVGWITHETATRLAISQECVTDELTSTSTVWRSTTIIPKTLVVKRRKLT